MLFTDDSDELAEDGGGRPNWLWRAVLCYRLLRLMIKELIVVFMAVCDLSTLFCSVLVW